MAILVTGGAGFVGSHLVESLLRSGDERILCLDNFNDYYDPARKRANVAGFIDNPRVEVIRCSLLDADTLLYLFRHYDCTHVAHLAAHAGVHASVRNPRIYQETNVLGTLNLLEAARRYPVERFVNISSSTVYGVGASAPFVEDAPLGTPISPYGVSKLAAELLAKNYCLHHGVPTVSLRLFSVYGPRLRPDLALSRFAECIFRLEKLPLYGNGSVERDFTHVSDICQGIEAAMVREEAIGEAINLGNDRPVSIRRVIHLLEQAIGCPARIDYQPPRDEDLPRTHADLNKARRLLDYEPRVAFEDGVRDYVHWLRDTRFPQHRSMVAARAA